MGYRPGFRSRAALIVFVAVGLAGATTAGLRAQEANSPLSSVLVINPGYRLLLDTKKGSIISFRSTFGADRNLLIPDHARLPLFKIEFLIEKGQFKTVTSSEAQQVSVNRDRDADSQIVTIEFKAIAQLPLDARVTIRCPRNESLTYWSLELNNRTTYWVGHIQFPVIEVPFDRPVHAGNLYGLDADEYPVIDAPFGGVAHGHYSHILWSFADGALAGPVEPWMPLGTWGGRDYDTPEIWRYNNYPGEWTSTQLMAYYNDAGGLYVACDDPKGLPKFLGPLLERDGVTMGVGHYPGTRGPGETRLPYHVVLGTFHGDWYAAAEIYRDWASKQPFCATKLAQRTDVPKWLADPLVGIAFPMRGQGDWDPHGVNSEYTPLTNALPYLEKLSSALAAPLMPIVFNWEQAGPWVQPDAYPPLGGEAAFREFMTRAREQGWHPVLYGDGLCWVTYQKNTQYDGMPYFKAHDGEAAVARKWDGSLLEDVWAWRRNYVACVGTEKGRQMVLEMTRRMAAFGPDVVQQFDQTPGPRACYAADHGHPPVPGPWLTEAFTELVKSDEGIARSLDSGVAMSCEGAPPETYLQNFQTWDGRIKTCPLYSFLYHEYANGHVGFYTNRVNDEALRASVARALVTGYISNFTLRDQGRIEYDWDQTWTRAVPDQAAIIDWAKRTSHFRSGVARDYLVYGRMLRPWAVSGVSRHDYGWGPEPVVESATWQAQDGRIGVVLANYGDLPESPRVELEGQGIRNVTIVLDDQRQEQRADLPRALEIPMQPRSLCLIEVR